MYEIGLSSCSKEINEKLFQDYNASEIKMMEISCVLSECKILDYKSIEKWAKNYNVTLWSYHLPFAPFTELEISDFNLYKDTIMVFEELIKKASNIGITKFIIHPSGEPIEDIQRGEKMKCAKESLAHLAQFAKKNGAQIAVENLPRTCLGKNSDEISELISVDENLGVCFEQTICLEKIVWILYIK